jgi:malate dehydrogenase
MELSSKADEAFDGTNWALLVGSVPRKQGMERADLLSVNGKIFGPQGQAIARKAASDVRILVVGNPCNTNAYIARLNAPEIHDDRWFAMTRLDENRARSQLAHKAKVPVAAISNVAIWGNHSTTQYPDARNARIAGLPVFDVVSDHGWLRGKFIETVQKRGAAVIEARGASSAASAANAVVDSVQSIRTPTPWGDWHSLAVTSHGEYGVPEGLQFGFPVRSDGEHWEVVPDLQHDDDAWDRIKKTTQELMQERDLVKELIPSQA